MFNLVTNCTLHLTGNRPVVVNVTLPTLTKENANDQLIKKDPERFIFARMQK